MSNFFETRQGMIVGSIFLSALIVGGLIWFWLDVAELFFSIIKRQPTIDFDKGAMYLLGGGISLSAVLAAVLPKAFFNKNLSETATNLVGKGMLYGFILMLSLPQLVHFGVWTTLKSWDYVNCQNLGTQWLMHKTFVFTDSAETCLKLVVNGRE